MPALEDAILEYLTSDAGVTALVADRIYPGRLKTGALIPAISFFKVSANRIDTYDHFEDESAFVNARVQFDCWSNAHAEAANVGDAVLAALSGYDGSLGGELIQASFATNEIDTYDGPTKYHRRILEFQLFYEDVTTGS